MPFGVSSTWDQPPRSPLIPSPTQCLQCLSAFRPLGTLGQGSETYDITGLVSNAFRRFVHLGQRIKVNGILFVITESPMPFGVSSTWDHTGTPLEIALAKVSNAFRRFVHLGRMIVNAASLTIAYLSPMPFGVSSTWDLPTGPQEALPSMGSLQCLSAFRPLGTWAKTLSMLGGKVCLQCLSAFRPLGTAGSLNAYGIRVKRPVLTDLRNPGENRYSK